MKKVGIISFVIYFIYLLLGIIALLFLIPSITEINNTLSIYILARKVHFGDFIRRIDAVFILIWIMSILSYLAIVMHFILSSFKKVSGIKNESPMVFCFSAFLFIISMVPNDIADLNYFESTFYKYSSIIFVFGISFIVLICAYIKRRKELRKGVNNFEKAN